jgi:hypothetical protein
VNAKRISFFDTALKSITEPALTLFDRYVQNQEVPVFRSLYLQRNSAWREISRSISAADIEDSRHNTVERRVAEEANGAIRKFAAAQDDLIESFLISGAHLRDLCLEQGPVVMESCGRDVVRDSYQVIFHTTFRII